jgi:hypothetical protein
MKKTIFALTLMLSMGASAFSNQPKDNAIKENAESTISCVSGTLSCGVYFAYCGLYMWETLAALIIAEYEICGVGQEENESLN